jgi:hypothetical protein
MLPATRRGPWFTTGPHLNIVVASAEVALMDQLKAPIDSWSLIARVGSIGAATR